MPGTRRFFVVCLGIALLLVIAVPVLGGLFTQHVISDAVAQGFRIWQADDCAGCHSLNGQGGGYASDLTRIYSLRDETYLRDFLLNSDTSASNAVHTIPHIAIPEGEISSLLAFLMWADENNGDFPPFPEGEIGNFSLKPEGKLESSP